MLIATFGPTTGWAGKTITREGDAFILEGHGPITAADVMAYDEQGHLVWANPSLLRAEGTRTWVAWLVSAESREPVWSRVPVGGPLMATLKPPSPHSGRMVYVEDRVLYLQGHERITMGTLLLWDRWGQVTWATEELRVWAAAQNERITAPTLPRIWKACDGAWSELVASVRRWSHRHDPKGLYPEPQPLISGGLYVGIWIVGMLLIVVVAGVTAALYGAAAGTVSAILLGVALSLIIGGINKAYARRK